MQVLRPVAPEIACRSRQFNAFLLDAPVPKNINNPNFTVKASLFHLSIGIY
jgi:hypothetical protein